MKLEVRQWFSGLGLARVVLPMGLVCAAIATSIAAVPSPEPVAVSNVPPAPPATATTATPGLPTLAPLAYQKETVDLVVRHLLETHYQKQPLDDALSGEWFDAYLDALDPQRLIFRASDIAEFEQYRDKFDDLVRHRPNPDLSAAILMYERYRTRYLEFSQASAQLAAQPVDLSNEESWTLRSRKHDPESGRPPWPSSDAEARELWRQRVEDEFIQQLLQGRDPEEKIRERIVKRHTLAPKNLEQMEVDDVLQVWLDALGGLYDPHTNWMPPADSDNFQVDITNSVVGIGAQLGKEDEYVTVQEVIRGGPASKDGKLKKKDRILAVGQDDEEPVAAENLRLDKVVSMIRGKIGTQVVLQVEHADGQQETIELTRERVQLEEGKAQGALERSGGHTYGYVQLPSFYVAPPNNQGGHGAADDVAIRIRELQAAAGAANDELDGVVLDLRGNGGGSLREAVELAGIFLPGGAVVQVRDRQGRIDVLHDDNKDVVWGGRLMVLTDATSASASEIVAGALQDYGRALVVGDPQTHGKGTVQELVELTDELRGHYAAPVAGQLKYTIQKFYRVNGGSTQREGVKADVVLPSLWAGYDVFEQDLDHALPWDEITPAVYVRVGDPAAQAKALQAKSDARVAADDDYRHLSRITADILARRDDATVSLQLDERKAELEASKALAFPEVPEDLDGEARKAELRKRDFQLDESLQIFDDWLAAG